MVNSQAVCRRTSSCHKIAGSQRRVPFERFEGYILAARFAERGDDSSVVSKGRRTAMCLENVRSIRAQI